MFGSRVILIGTVALSMSAFAADDLIAQSDQAAVVKERQNLMREMGKSFGPLLAIVRGENPNIADAVPAATTMNTNAQRIVAVFPDGSGRDAVADTRARPEVWAQRADFEAAASKLVEESGKLLEVASSSDDLDAFRTQFQAFGASCGGCHDGPPDSGGKFRFPK